MNLKLTLPVSVVAVSIAALLVGGCATGTSSSASDGGPVPIVKTQKSGSATLVGTLSYPASATLPADASATVALVRATYIEEAAEILNSTVISPLGRSPIKYSLPYDPSQIKPGERYSVAARVFSGGKLIMRSNAYLVFNLGGPSNDVAIDLIPVK